MRLPGLGRRSVVAALDQAAMEGEPCERSGRLRLPGQVGLFVALRRGRRNGGGALRLPGRGSWAAMRDSPDLHLSVPHDVLRLAAMEGEPCDSPDCSL